MAGVKCLEAPRRALSSYGLAIGWPGTDTDGEHMSLLLYLEVVVVQWEER